jgi:hypothetical protein
VTEQIRVQSSEQPQVIEPQPEPAPASDPVPKPTAAEPATPPEDKLRAEFADIATIAAQAARLGVTVDAADAMRKGVSADALRRSILDTLAARTEATSVIATAPTTPVAGDSPIVRRARERAAAARA